jgi:hydrogenase expression/formation protein HypE
MSKIEIGHGSGGSLTHELIKKLFLKYLDSEELRPLEDAAYIDLKHNSLAISTDSYVVRPLFFPGGDIGKLSICGTVNDLTVSGANTRFITVGFILEEGFLLEHLEIILKSIRDTSKMAGVRVVGGDTKVVEKEKCDGVYINTTAVGEVVHHFQVNDVSEGDVIIITGTVGDHGTAVALARDEFSIETHIASDCAPLNGLLCPLFETEGIKWMRDPTRGGIATALKELSESSGLGIYINERKIPVREDVRFVSEMLGYDPLYLANEGKAIVVTSQNCAEKVLEQLRSHPLGKEAAIIGSITSSFNGVRLKTKIGGERVIDMLEEELLPRIC